MEWNEFRDQLARALAARGVPNAADILKDFDEHYEEALRAGQSEREICATLGDPEEIAEQCAEDMGTGEERPPAAGGAGEIYLRMTSANLVLEPSASAEFTVRVERRGLVVEWDRPDQEEDILVERSATSLLVKQVRYTDILSRILSGLEMKTVYIGVPRGFDGTVTARIRSGNLRMEHIRGVRSLTSDITSGNTQIAGMETGHMDLHSLSGNIRTLRCAGDLTARTTSGNVQVEGHRGNVSAASTSGSVQVETDRMDRDCTLSTTSGRVSLKLARLEANLQLKCASGGVSLEIQHLAGDVTATTVSGNVTAHLGGDTRAVFALRPDTAKNDFSQGEPGMGLPAVSLSSRSGSVRVRRL